MTTDTDKPQPTSNISAREALERAVALLRGLHKVVQDLAPHFEKPITDDNVVRWLALNSAQAATADFLDALAASLPQGETGVLKGWEADHVAHCDQMKREAGVPEGWRGIDSAPLDGTEILFTEHGENGYGEIDIGCWGFIEKSDADGSDIIGWLSNYGRITEPTHWMPLPAMLSAAPAAPKEKP